LIVGISAYLFYQQREQFNGLASGASIPGLVLLIAIVTIWMIAVLASVQAIQFVILPLILWLMVLSVLGWRSAWMVVLPVAYLYLAIPIWESGNFVLQWMTVRAVEFALWVFQVPAYIEGNVVSLPAGSFSVDGGCSGLHYFIISIALSVLYGALYLRSAGNRLLLIALGVGAALLTNWLRVFIVVYAGHLTDMQHYLVTHNHYYFGWVLFVIALVPYLLFARRLEISEDDATVGDVPSVVSAPAIAAYWSLVMFSVCTMFLLVANVTIHAKMPAGQAIEATVSLPAARGDWTVDPSAKPDWHPHYVGAAAESAQSYRSESGLVDAYFNLYRGQIQGRELIGYDNRVEGLDGWRQVSTNVKMVSSNGRADVRLIREIQLATETGGTRLLYLWYDVDGKPMIRDLWTKLRIGANLLLRRRDAGVRIVSVECGKNCDDARKLLQSWMNAHVSANGDRG
jgi:EpsI family protein